MSKRHLSGRLRLTKAYSDCRGAFGKQLVTHCKEVYQLSSQLVPRVNLTRLEWAKVLTRQIAGVNAHTLQSYIFIGEHANNLRPYPELVDSNGNMSNLVAYSRLPPELLKKAVEYKILQETTTVKDLTVSRVSMQCSVIERKLAKQSEPEIAQMPEGNAYFMDNPPESSLKPGPIIVIKKQEQGELPLDPSVETVALGLYKTYGNEFIQALKGAL